MTVLHNARVIARREFGVRIRTRTFLVGTVLLMLGVAIVSFVPVIVSYFDQTDGQKVAVYIDAPGAPADLVSTLDVLLNVTADTGKPTTTTTREFLVSTTGDLQATRTEVTKGAFAAVLAVGRAADGELAFTLYTNSAMGRTAQLVQQAVASITVSDRLARLGVASAQQAGLFAPPSYAIRWSDPARTDQASDTTSLVTGSLLGFGMTLLIFMMIILYGNWVAMSVVEEKSSRVMEVVLNAATPFQLLTGKVLGVGAVAFVQYMAILVAGIGALILQGSVASLVLGESSGGAALPEGLTAPMLLAFGIYGVLGFLLYAVLYAAAGSLVSRQEDVNQAVMPMTLISTAGYLVAVYAAAGLLDIQSGWMKVLSQVPFVSPFLMVSRITSGEATWPEVALSIAILIVTIAGCLWLAARIYTAGVLMYGQRPGLRATWRLIRQQT